MKQWNATQIGTTALACANALVLMRRALGMLDEAGCAPDIGAHLDLAAVRLEEWMLRGGYLGRAGCEVPLATGTDG